MSRNAARRSGCPLNIALEIIGDRWSLLVVRDLMLKGAHTFKDLMEGGEGIATNILTDRLELLVREEIVAKFRMEQDRRKFLYQLTEKGLGLAPVLVEMMVWADGFEDTDAPKAAISQMKSSRPAFLRSVRETWKRERRRLAKEGGDA